VCDIYADTLMSSTKYTSPAFINDVLTKTVFTRIVAILASINTSINALYPLPVLSKTCLLKDQKGVIWPPGARHLKREQIRKYAAFDRYAL